MPRKSSITCAPIRQPIPRPSRGNWMPCGGLKRRRRRSKNFFRSPSNPNDRSRVVPSLIQGRIVFARKAIVDPQGKNPKCDRPFVIISPTAQILPGKFVVGVAISSDQIDLPFGDNAKAGLKIQCAAICDWLVALKQDELDFGTSFLSAAYLEEIIKK